MCTESAAAQMPLDKQAAYVRCGLHPVSANAVIQLEYFLRDGADAAS
jgi:hypothetical protein